MKRTFFTGGALMPAVMVALCAAVLSCLCARAWAVQARAGRLGGAALAAAGASDVFYACDDPSDMAAKLGGEADAACVTVRYDSDWRPGGDEYLLTMALGETDGLLSADISVGRGGETFFALRCEKCPEAGS